MSWSTCVGYIAELQVMVDIDRMMYWRLHKWSSLCIYFDVPRAHQHFVLMLTCTLCLSDQVALLNQNICPDVNLNSGSTWPSGTTWTIFFPYSPPLIRAKALRLFQADSGMMFFVIREERTVFAHVLTSSRYSDTVSTTQGTFDGQLHLVRVHQRDCRNSWVSQLELVDVWPDLAALDFLKQRFAIVLHLVFNMDLACCPCLFVIHLKCFWMGTDDMPFFFHVATSFLLNDEQDTCLGTLLVCCTG